MNKDKSQKRKNNNINKPELWNIFDSEILEFLTPPISNDSAV
jgi:hypothetical protein